jgi:hypothetical protein
MRIATYNVENLFSRARAMTGDNPARTSVVLADVAILQRLIEQPVYSDADKARIGDSEEAQSARRERAVFSPGDAAAAGFDEGQDRCRRPRGLGGVDRVATGTRRRARD